MEPLRLVFLFAHLIGFALLLGGGITQAFSGKLRINPAMVWGAITQLVTGLALASLHDDDDAESEPAKLAVKGVIAVLIAIMVLVPAARKRKAVAAGHFWATVGLTLTNAAVAVFWH